MIQIAKKAKQGKGMGSARAKKKTKEKGKGKRMCSFFNKGGCQRVSACMFQHKTPAMAAKAPEPAAPAAAQTAKRS